MTLAVGMGVSVDGVEYRADENEVAALGIALRHPDAVLDMARAIKPEDFGLPSHEAIAKAMWDLSEDRDAIDAMSVWTQIRANGDDRAVIEGLTYLLQLVETAPAAQSLVFHLKAIKEASARRRLYRIGLTSQKLSGDASSGSVAGLVEALRSELEAVSDEVSSGQVPTVGSHLDDVLAEVERVGIEGAVVGIPTGFPDLDSKLHGLRPGQLVVMAGRPAMGKSTIMMDAIRSAALQHDKSVLLFSLEMSTQEVLHRLISAQARVELGNLQTGKVSEEEWARIHRVYDKIAQSRIGIDDSPGLTVADIRAKARAFQSEHGLDMIAVDYLQLLSPVRRLDSRQQEVSEMSRTLKILAKEFGVPIVALSQLNRGSEQRSDKRPMLSDLRESGAIEQDSDVVLLLHRDEVYNPEIRVGEADVIIAKQRSGPTGIVPVVAQLHYSRFVPAARTFDDQNDSAHAPGSPPPNPWG